MDWLKSKRAGALGPDSKWGVDEPFQLPPDVREWLIGFTLLGQNWSTWERGRSGFGCNLLRTTFVCYASRHANWPKRSLLAGAD